MAAEALGGVAARVGTLLPSQTLSRVLGALWDSLLNLDELARKSKEELVAIIGAQNGKLLYDFLRREG